MLRGLAAVGSRFVATRSSNARSLPAADLAERARPHFAAVEVVADPTAAVRRAHALGEPVLVTGSLYLLADLEAAERSMRRRSRTRERLDAFSPSRSSSSRSSWVARSPSGISSASFFSERDPPLMIADAFFDSNTWIARPAT